MPAVKTLTDWCVRGSTPYAAPEQGIYLNGKREDGHYCTTSRVVDVLADGTVRTASGSIYRLLEVRPEYLAWCKDLGRHIPTPEQPIIMIRGAQS